MNPELEKRARGLVRKWRKDAARFHEIGVRLSREGGDSAESYLQTGAAFRCCARELSEAIRQK